MTYCGDHWYELVLTLLLLVAAFCSPLSDAALIQAGGPEGEPVGGNASLLQAAHDILQGARLTNDTDACKPRRDSVLELGTSPEAGTGFKLSMLIKLVSQAPAFMADGSYELILPHNMLAVEQPPAKPPRSS